MLGYHDGWTSDDERLIQLAMHVAPGALGDKKINMDGACTCK